MRQSILLSTSAQDRSSPACHVQTISRVPAYLNLHFLFGNPPIRQGKKLQAERERAGNGCVRRGRIRPPPRAAQRLQPGCSAPSRLPPRAAATQDTWAPAPLVGNTVSAPCGRRGCCAHPRDVSAAAPRGRLARPGPARGAAAGRSSGTTRNPGKSCGRSCRAQKPSAGAQRLSASP